MPLRPEDVRSKQFSTVRLKEGYEMDEVDSFLDEVEGELTRLLRDNDDLRSQATRAAAEPAAAAAPAPVAAAAPAAAVGTDSAVRMLELAQRTADEHVAQAKAEADKLVADAHETHRRTMAGLEGERTALQAKIDDLRSFEKEYRTRLKSYLEGQLRDLDAKAPAAAPAPGGAPATPAVAQPQAPAPTGAPAAPAGAPTPAVQSTPTVQPPATPPVQPSAPPAAPSGPFTPGAPVSGSPSAPPVQPPG